MVCRPIPPQELQLLIRKVPARGSPLYLARFPRTRLGVEPRCPCKSIPYLPSVVNLGWARSFGLEPALYVASDPSLLGRFHPLIQEKFLVLTCIRWTIDRQYPQGTSVTQMNAIAVSLTSRWVVVG